jgi:hypothetical protein
MEGVGISVYHTPSYPTTAITKRIWGWYRLRCYMVISANPHCFGMGQESIKFLDPTYCKKVRDEFIWWETTCGLCSQGRRDTPTIGEENWVSKLVITCISRCHLWEVHGVSRYKASSHLGALVHSGSRRREKKNLKQNFWISFLIHPNREGKIHFKGVGLSHPKISKFGMWLKLTIF